MYVRCAMSYMFKTIVIRRYQMKMNTYVMIIATILLRMMLNVDGRTISEMIIRQHLILITFKE